MSETDIVGYSAGGYAWCPTCYQEGAHLAHQDEPLQAVPADAPVDDDIFCAGCGRQMRLTDPALRGGFELGQPEAG